MTRQNKTYRKLILFLYPLYVNFFLLTPFFHYHPEENSIQPDKFDIHSHLLIDHDDEHKHHESEHHVEDCDHHQHVYLVNTYKFTKMTKIINVNQINSNLSFNNIPAEPVTNKINTRIFTEDALKILMERSVHTATNSSPPIA